MAGNSKRRGSIRKDGTKKGMVVGSGGQRRRALEGKGPTPPKEMRPGHPAARRSARRSSVSREALKVVAMSASIPAESRNEAASTQSTCWSGTTVMSAPASSGPAIWAAE